MALQEEAHQKEGPARFVVEACFISVKPPVYTKLGQYLQRVGDAWHEGINADGNGSSPEAGFQKAVNDLRVIAGDIGLELEEGLAGNMHALIWADKLFTHLRENYDYLRDLVPPLSVKG